MATHHPSTSHNRTTIETYGYVRTADPSEPPYLELMESLLVGAGNLNSSSGGDWAHFRISLATDSSVEICRYSVSRARRSYFTTKIDLDQLGPGSPRMKHRDLVVDNCRSAGVDLRRLRALGLNLVANEEAATAAENAFDARGLEWDGEGDRMADLVRVFTAYAVAVLTAYNRLFDDNPLLIGQVKMLQNYQSEFGGAAIDKISILTRKVPSLQYQRGLFIVSHLRRK
ncbi:hypothetical protein SLS62_011343 [Diatrype stigma]|uniref:Uncharacterized protein n=1 Tax=Diatrype stigma TaxID=117547 RepID=A0AAN9UB86_9PEZI